MRKLDLGVPYFSFYHGDTGKCQLSPPPPSLKIVPAPLRGVKFTCKPMFGSVLNGFCPKEAPFNFLPLIYNGDVVKLPDLGSQIYKFRDYHFIDTVTDINH